MELINNLFNNLTDSKSFKLLVIVIVFDTLFGILRAIKDHKINSAVGIDGIIRKSGMLLCIIFMNLIDKLVSINLIGFIPDNIKNFLNLDYVGFNELFIIIFVCFELLSILKNMILCKLPIPRKLQEALQNIMTAFTGEMLDGNHADKK